MSLFFVVRKWIQSHLHLLSTPTENAVCGFAATVYIAFFFRRNNDDAQDWNSSRHRCEKVKVKHSHPKLINDLVFAVLSFKKVKYARTLANIHSRSCKRLGITVPCRIILHKVVHNFTTFYASPAACKHSNVCVFLHNMVCYSNTTKTTNTKPTSKPKTDPLCSQSVFS